MDTGEIAATLHGAAEIVLEVADSTGIERLRAAAVAIGACERALERADGSSDEKRGAPRGAPR